MSDSTNEKGGRATARYGTRDTQYAMKMARTRPEDDGPLWMVNLMKYRGAADYADGRDSTISGREADDLYSPIDSLVAVGARPVFFATSINSCSATKRCGIASPW